jgi:hypothetical protein
MRNATVLLAVVAMLAGTAYGSLVDEDFDSGDPGWTSVGMGTAGTSGLTSDFGYEVNNPGAQAITGTWARNDITSRYYTDIGTTLNQSNDFTFGFDLTINSYSMRGVVQVGLLNTDETTNVVNSFSVMFTYNYLYLSRFDKNGDWANWEYASLPGLTLGTAYQFEVEYDPTGNGGNGTVGVYQWEKGTTKPDTPTYYNGTGGNWAGNDWTVNAFGAYNMGGTSGGGYTGTADATVDNMYLVPEPATMAFLGIGGIGILIRRKRR